MEMQSVFRKKRFFLWLQFFWQDLSFPWDFDRRNLTSAKGVIYSNHFFFFFFFDSFLESGNTAFTNQTFTVLVTRLG